RRGTNGDRSAVWASVAGGFATGGRSADTAAGFGSAALRPPGRAAASPRAHGPGGSPENPIAAGGGYRSGPRCPGAANGTSQPGELAREIRKQAFMLRALLSATRSAKQDDPWDLAGRVAQLESAHRSHYQQPDLLLVRRAYRIAEQMHRGQARKSGEPYITHPIEVSTILAELGVDTATIAAGLLHDTVEDTSYSLEA